MSGYQRINFKDQNVERPKTYDVTNNPDGSITLIESFGNVEELGTPINQENMNHIEDGLSAVSFSKYNIDTVFQEDEFATDIQDGKLMIIKSLKDNNYGHLPSESDYWEEVEISGGGGGLEIGDISIAPLGIDETKGKRRYLNGQIIIQDKYAIFSEKVKSAIAQYPTLGCTEQEWQTIATKSVGGQVGKFVVDNEGGTIRLPKIIMPIQGLTDLSKLAEIVSAGMPNVTQTFTAPAYIDITGDNLINTTRGSSSVGTQNQTSTLKENSTWSIDFSRANSIYGNSDTVQQEQIQYPYFIQVATGCDEGINTIREIELNNPYVLLESKYFESEVYNVSWLLANGSYNGSNAIYPSAYQALLVENNAEVAIGSIVTLPIGTEYTKRGLSVKLSTDNDITDYDFVINTSDETFRLPIKVNLAGGKAVVGNGIALGLTDNNTNAGLYRRPLDNGSGVLSYNINAYGETLNSTTTTTDYSAGQNNVGVTTDPTKSGIETSTEGLHLYFYVGETVQNANLINAGRIEEKLSNKVDLSNTNWAISSCIPDYTAGVTKSNNVDYIAEVAGLLVASDSGNNNCYVYINGVKVGETGGSATNVIYNNEFFVDKGDVYKLTNWNKIAFYPLKGAN